jgi:hypothetical protein
VKPEPAVNPRWVDAPRGARTGAVLEALDSFPARRTQFRVIERVTGLDPRTLTSILYSLQLQGKVVPLNEAKPRSEVVYARVDHQSVKPAPPARVLPYAPRRRKGLAEQAKARHGEVSYVSACSIPDEIGPAWLVPRMPANGVHSVGQPAVQHCLVTTKDLEYDETEFEG